MPAMVNHAWNSSSGLGVGRTLSVVGGTLSHLRVILEATFKFLDDPLTHKMVLLRHSNEPFTPTGDLLTSRSDHLRLGKHFAMPKRDVFSSGVS